MTWPGCSLKMPRNIVSSPATDRLPSSSGIADSFASGWISPPGPVKRLDAEAVAGEEEAAARRVPDRKREHAAEMLDAVVAELLVGMDDGFGVGAAVVAVAVALEADPQIGVVVDFAVEDD